MFRQSQSFRIFGFVLVGVMSVLALWRLNEPPLYPREPNTLSVGMKKFGSGKYAKAYRSIRKVLSLNPNNSKARNLVELLRIVDIPIFAKPLEDPEGRLYHLSQKLPDSPYLKMVGAELLLSISNPAQARLLSLKAVSDYPNIPHNWYLLGLSQRELGEKENAIRSIKRAINLEPQQRYFAALGDCYFFNGEWELASKNYKTAFEGKKFYLPSKIGYFRSLIYTGEYVSAIAFGRKLLKIVSTSVRLPQNSRNKARLIVSLSNYEVITDLTQAQLVEYITTLLSIANKLVNDENPNSSTILKSSDLAVRPALKFDISQFLSAGI